MLSCSYNAAQKTQYYLEVGYILLLPVALIFLYGFTPFNNTDGYIDPWLYFGYVHNWGDLISRYGLPYYAVRFGLIFPLILTTWLAGDILGYIIFVYLMYLLAGIPLYLVFRNFFSVHSAILAYTILVSSVWFARAVLWTYPDATAVPYLIAATSLIILDTKYRRLTYLIIGILFAMAVNSNAFAFAIAGLTSILYVCVYRDTFWVRVKRDMPWMAAGFILVIAAGSVGYYLCCNTFNYYRSTLEVIKWSNSGGGLIYKAPIQALLQISYLYLPPFIILALFIIRFYIHDVYQKRLLDAVLCYLVATTIFFIWYQYATNSALLETFFYFSYFLVPGIFSIILVPVLLASISNKGKFILNLATAGFIFIPVLLSQYMLMITDISIYMVFAGCGLVLALIFFFSGKTLPVLILLFILTYQLFWNSPYQLSWTDSDNTKEYVYSNLYNKLDIGMTRYRLGLKFIEAIPKFKDEQKPVYFWYRDQDEVAMSLQSTYLWSYSQVMSTSAVGLPSYDGVNQDLLRQRSSLVLFDRDINKVEQGITVLKENGLIFSIKSKEDICEGELCYAIAILDVESKLPGNDIIWDQEQSDAFEYDLSWHFPESSLEIKNDINKTIHTAAAAWQYAAVGILNYSGQLQQKAGVIRMELSVEEGSIGIGFLGSDESNFIKRMQIYPSIKPFELFFEFENIYDLKKIIIQTWDKPKSARVKLLDFEIRTTGN